jgi:hypothetical protein
VRRTNAAKVLGVSPDDEAADIKRVYRKLIATEHPDRNPNASVEKFNAIKDAYEVMSDRGGQGGATFVGLGDKAKRDFRTLDGLVLGGAVQDMGAKKIAVVMQNLTLRYDTICNVFIARNITLAAKPAKAAAAAAAAASASQSVDDSVDGGSVDGTVDHDVDPEVWVAPVGGAGEPAAAGAPVAS